MHELQIFNGFRNKKHESYLKWIGIYKNDNELTIFSQIVKNIKKQLNERQNKVWKLMILTWNDLNVIYSSNNSEWTQHKLLQ